MHVILSKTGKEFFKKRNGKTQYLVAVKIFLPIRLFSVGQEYNQVRLLKFCVCHSPALFRVLVMALGNGLEFLGERRSDGVVYRVFILLHFVTGLAFLAMDLET